MNKGDPDECKSVAFEALTKAVDSHDPIRGATIKTHIGNSVRLALLEHQRESFGRYTHIKDGHPWTNNLRARQELKKNLLQPENINDYQNNYKVSANGTEQKVINKDLAHKILSFIKTPQPGPPLKKRARNVKIFIDSTLNDLTFNEIAKEQNITKQRVSQIVIQVKARAKNRFQDAYQNA